MDLVLSRRKTEERIMSALVNAFISEGSANSPRMKTDVFFPLPAKSNVFTGALMDCIRFIERIQLMDADLWKLFVHQFQLRNTDDADLGWRCEYWGKMMRGGCFVWQVTHDAQLYAVLEHSVCSMLSAQDSLGRFSTYSVENEFRGWDIWGRKYILLGMQYFMEICENRELNARILSALCRHADYMLEKLGPEDEGKLEINQATSHWHGLNSSSILEPIVRLYNLTGEERYLDFAAYIVNRGGTSIANLFELAYEDKLDPCQYPVTKAYEMMSCFEGLLEYYRATGIEKWRDAVLRFAKRVAHSDITIIGSAGCTHELLDHSSTRQLDASNTMVMQETCVTVTWMKLCFQVLCLTGDVFFADAIEQSAYNALLGAVNHDQVKENHGYPFDSYSPLLPGRRGRATGGYKEMENGTGYGCCACIGSAGLGLAGLFAVVAARDGLAINTFLNGSVTTVTPSGKPLGIKTETGYPKDHNIRMTISLLQAEKFSLLIRIPGWSERNALSVNGETVPCERGTYALLHREWIDGDCVALTLDSRVMVVRPEDYGVLSSDAPYLALKYGPLVLARDARLLGDIEERVAIACLSDGSALATRAQNSPYPCQIAFEIMLSNRTSICMTDYASAGKTWKEDSRMAAWFPASTKADIPDL